VPVGIVVPLVDATMFDGALRRVLPAMPDDLLFWTVVFNVPHVVASELLLLDREYIRHYGKHMLFAATAIAALTALAFTDFLPPVFWLWFGATVLMYHVIGQQVGILRMMGGGTPGKILEAWKVLAVVTFLLGLGQTFAPADRLAAGSALTWIGVGLCASTSVLALVIWRRLQAPRAKLYLLANQVMFLSFLPLAAGGYSFFLLIIPRFVHDLTAFAFYVNHDQNRNRERKHGLLYRAFGFTRLPVWVLLPGVSIAIGLVLVEIDPVLLVHPVGTLSLFHYYMEAVSWRSSGLHRRSIALA